MVPTAKLAQRVITRAAPHAGLHNAGRATASGDRRAEDGATVGAVGIELTGCLGQGTAAGSAVMHIAWGQAERLDQGGIGIGADMSLEAVDRPAPLVASPTRLWI